MCPTSVLSASWYLDEVSVDEKHKTFKKHFVLGKWVTDAYCVLLVAVSLLFF